MARFIPPDHRRHLLGRYRGLAAMLPAMRLRCGMSSQGCALRADTRVAAFDLRGNRDAGTCSTHTIAHALHAWLR
ncbi:hypothetical protein LMG919_16050 [Xanthomonas vesicatoria]|nr:hypothetical protein LMG919_16050 [Xanthomonas vesicatoria]